MNTKDLYEEIRKIIAEETKFNRSYNGKIVKLDDGKVYATIEELGWNTLDKAAICNYSDKNSLKNMKLNDIILIGFVNNNPARAFVIGKGNNFINMKPKDYNFLNKDVIYIDANENVKITYDNILNEVSISMLPGTRLKINSGTEQNIKGTTTLPELQKDSLLMQILQNSISGWTPVPNDGGAALKAALNSWLSLPQANYGNILSTTIAGE